MAVLSKAVLSPPPADRFVVFLSGAGLSAASGIPTFRDADGLWEGSRPEDVATPEAFAQDPERVWRFYDLRCEAAAAARPNTGHLALARLQAAWGTQRVRLVTQNVDGLLDRAGCTEVIEMHGSLWRWRCGRSVGHGVVELQPGDSPPERCARCGDWMRPSVVWFGEVPIDLDRIGAWATRCHSFFAVGTSGLVYPAASYAALARRSGARSVEINPVRTGGSFELCFELCFEQCAEVALPALVEAWI